MATKDQQNQGNPGGPPVAPAPAAPATAPAAAAPAPQPAIGGGIGGPQSPFTPVYWATQLHNNPPVTVAFPPCSELLLSLIRTNGSDDITRHFNDYFKFQRHVTLVGTVQDLQANLDGGLLNCLAGGPLVPGVVGAVVSTEWPNGGCLPAPCVTLQGDRNTPPKSNLLLKRLFVGDAIWLFFFERLGIFQILGSILDAYAYSGRLPISNGSLPGIRDDLLALVLEAATRQTKTGMASTVRDRGSLYRTALGWVSKQARDLDLDTEVNTGFSTLFHRFIYYALEYYRYKNLASVFNVAAGTVPPTNTATLSITTLVTIGETIDLLKKRFEAFSYGRNYYNTLSSIVWAVSAMSVVREIAPTLGIPPAYNEPYEYIAAAYDLLVLKRPVTHGTANRYKLHYDCAKYGRNIILDLEVVDHTQQGRGGELEQWLMAVEHQVESYRTAYRELTGVDLGASPEPTVEQAA